MMITKARSSSGSPIAKCTELKTSPISTPAMPASAPEIRNTCMFTGPGLMPSSREVCSE